MFWSHVTATDDEEADDAAPPRTGGRRVIRGRSGCQDGKREGQADEKAAENDEEETNDGKTEAEEEEAEEGRGRSYRPTRSPGELHGHAVVRLVRMFGHVW